MRVRYPGALLPVLENFRPVFSPDPIDWPWVSEDAWTCDNLTSDTSFTTENLAVNRAELAFKVARWPSERQNREKSSSRDRVI